MTAPAMLLSSLRASFVLALAALVFAGCDVFGSKDDPITDEIFEEGETDPTLVDDVGYVALAPFFTQTLNGALEAPTDVFVGYDRFIYVADTTGLHVLDLAGRPQNFIPELLGQPLREIESIMQDPRLDLYVAARRDTTIEGRVWDLPVIYRLRGLTVGEPSVEDIIWHPFDDASRRFQSRFQNPLEELEDEAVAFTGVGVRPDNSIYVTRIGEVNTAADGRPPTIVPQNAVLLFTADGVNTEYLTQLGPVTPSLVSAARPTDIITFVLPNDQQTAPENTRDFFLAQSPTDRPAPFGVISVRVVESTLGIEYRPDTEKLAQASNPDAGDGFLYEEFKFEQPSDLAYATDGTGYLFVVDEAKDSLFVFNPAGVEGVRPPAGEQGTRPVPVSFGGEGGGPLEFRRPQGVAYFDEIVYVADTGNNRIARYRLNTDFE
jgi:hypothetical protein